MQDKGPSIYENIIMQLAKKWLSQAEIVCSLSVFFSGIHTYILKVIHKIQVQIHVRHKCRVTVQYQGPSIYERITKCGTLKKM